MSAQALEWLLELEDKMSAPASKAESRLEALEHRIKSLTEAEKKLEDPAMKKRVAARLQSLGLERIEARIAFESEKKESSSAAWVANLSHGFNVASSVLGVVTSIASTVWDFGKGVAGVVYKFAEMGIEAAASKEETIATFRALLGGRQAAIDMVEALDRQTASLKFTGDQTADIARRLLAGGFSQQDIPTYLRALSDASAATGASAEQTDAAVAAMRRINAEGKLTDKTLRTLTAAGIPASGVYEVLADDLKVTAEQARALVKSGKVNANEGLWAVVGSVTRKRSGGNLGTEGRRYAEETFAGLKKNFAHFREQLFDDLFETGGHGAIKSFWKNLNTAIDPDSPAGKRIRNRITDTFNRLLTTLFGPMAGADGLGRVEWAIGKLVDGVELAIGVARALWNVFEGLTKGALEGFGIKIDAIFGDDSKLNPAAIEGMVTAGYKFGTAIGYVAGKLERVVTLLSGADRFVKDWAWVGEELGITGGAPELSNDEKRAIMREEMLKSQYREWSSKPGFTPEIFAKAASKNGFSKAEINQVLHVGPGADPRAVKEAAKQGAAQGAVALEDLSFAGGGVA